VFPETVYPILGATVGEVEENLIVAEEGLEDAEALQIVKFDRPLAIACCTNREPGDPSREYKLANSSAPLTS